MLGATFSSFNFSEFESDNQSETQGRAGPDARVTDILSPRATSVDSMTGEMVNTLNAGKDVEFEVYLENIGDLDIEEMSVSLTVYLSEGGQRGMVAKDDTGNDLSWTNGDVVCDDTFVCPWSTLAPGSTLNYGRYTLSYQGSPITWTPITGEYVSVVSVDALNDANPGNDEVERFVSVTEWYDVVVDLAWDSGKNVESGSDSKAFTLSVETDGSAPWSLRNLTLQLEVSGMVSSATDSNGNDILGVSQIYDIGTYSFVEVFRHEIQPHNISNDSRYVIDSQTTAEWSGYLSPDASVNSGEYSVSVNLVEYVVYGQLPECEETLSANNSNNTGANPNATQEDTTFYHFCEVAFSTDANAATSEDMIEGYIQTFHDIGVSDLVINQGYDTDENGDRSETPNMPGITSGPLNPTWSSVQASVRHLGSDLYVTDDWKVTFDIQNTITGSTTTLEADNCTFGAGDRYEYAMLGESLVAASAFETGEACVWFEFEPGIYNISATISMVGESVSDMNTENDEMDINYAYSLNNRPSVTLTILQNSVVIGPDALITMEADVFDADDETGESLSYVWTHPGLNAINGTVQPSPCNGLGPSFSTCSLLAYDSEWVGTRVYSVTVSDEFGSSAMDFTAFFVWNHVIATDTTNSGITMEYNLTYNGVNEFMISLEDSSMSYTQDLSDFGYAGEYSSVAVLDYSPSTTYLPADVHDQEIEIHYDASSITPVGVFWVSTNGAWAELSSTITEAGSDGRIILDWGGDNQVLPQGEIVLMGGELQVIEVPTAYPMSISVVAQKGGTIQTSWGYTGTIIPSLDFLQMEICDSTGACSITLENTTLVMHTLSGQTDTVHGVTYTYTLSICNVAGCNPTTASASATADSMVDGSPGTSGVNVIRSDDSESWIISWDIFGDTSDVSGWMTCFADYSWSTLGEMPTNSCYETSLYSEIPYPNGVGNKVYYFTVFAFDDKGNMVNGLPQTYINHDHSITYSATDSDNDGVDDDFDLCPNTDQGLEVDSEGCPIDYDEDNYPNSIDDCPYVYGTSNKGQQTNRLVGCPDSDDDGWADSIDAFPDNSSEWLDTDDDGCGNNIDEFPNDPEECVDSDEDGVGDNSDLFPEDPEESSDKDGDGVGDSKDKCDSTKDGASIGKDGCQTEDESSGLVTGLAIGIGILSVIVIALIIVVFISRSRNVENDSDDFDDSMNYNQTEFVQQEFYQQEQTMRQPISKDVPQVHDTGNLDADGYEWIEYPSGSGIWYWRQSRDAGWTKHQ